MNTKQLTLASLALISTLFLSACDGDDGQDGVDGLPGSPGADGADGSKFEQVLVDYEGMGLNVRGIRAGDQFLEALAGESDPETKRKAIGRVFVEVFDEASQQVEGARWLGQGTIYPDVIESVSATGGPSATIKSHHNVGGICPITFRSDSVRSSKVGAKLSRNQNGAFSCLASLIGILYRLMPAWVCKG